MKKFGVLTNRNNKESFAPRVRIWINIQIQEASLPRTFNRRTLTKSECAIIYYRVPLRSDDLYNSTLLYRVILPSLPAYVISYQRGRPFFTPFWFSFLLAIKESSRSTVNLITRRNTGFNCSMPDTGRNYKYTSWPTFHIPIFHFVEGRSIDSTFGIRRCRGSVYYKFITIFFSKTINIYFSILHCKRRVMNFTICLL